MTAHILANSEAFSSINRYMNQTGPSGDLFYVYVTFACVILFWAGMFLWDRYRQLFFKKRPPTPKSLFAELAAAHKLNRVEKSLILNALGPEQEQEAALCFIDPSILAGKITSEIESVAEYEKLLSRLFGDAIS